jgi:hypothetical protein
MDYRFRLDLLMHFKSCIDLECYHWTCPFQQPGLSSTTMACNATYVGYHYPSLPGKLMVKATTQPYSNRGRFLPYRILFRQHHYSGCPRAA